MTPSAPDIYVSGEVTVPSRSRICAFHCSLSMQSNSSASSSNGCSSPFLLLPAEIRLNIYEILMIDSRGDILLISDNFVGHGQPIVRKNLSSQLLRAVRSSPTSRKRQLTNFACYGNRTVLSTARPALYSTVETSSGRITGRTSSSSKKGSER